MAKYSGFGLSHTRIFGINLIVIFFSGEQKKKQLYQKHCLAERIRMVYVPVADDDYWQSYGRISLVFRKVPILKTLLILHRNT